MLTMRLNRFVRPATTVAVGCALAAALTLSQARALQRESFSTFLYKGESEASSPIRLASWGSGRAELTRDNVFNGDAAIKITTHGLYQGGRLDFKTPLDLSKAFADKRTYLRMMVRFPNTSQTSFDPTTLQSSAAAAAPFEKMRYLAIMGDGKQYEMIRSVDVPPSEDVDAYVPLAFPIAAIAKAAGKTPSGAGAQLQSLVIAGDRYSQFLIGEMTLLTDETDISIAPLDDQVAFVNNEMTFIGNAEGGASSLKFAWDWDARDGIQEDSVGRTVTHTFRKAGKYTVTLIVSDADGIKKPQPSTIELDVQN